MILRALIAALLLSGSALAQVVDAGVPDNAIPGGAPPSPPRKLDESIERHRTAFEAVCRQRNDVVETESGWRLAVAQQERAGTLVDTEDRVQKAASFLRDLVAAGL